MLLEIDGTRVLADPVWGTRASPSHHLVGPRRLHPVPLPLVALPEVDAIVIDDGEVSGRYNVVALPHMVVLDREGAVRKIFMGVTTQSELASALRRAAN